MKVSKPPNRFFPDRAFTTEDLNRNLSHSANAISNDQDERYVYSSVRIPCSIFSGKQQCGPLTFSNGATVQPYWNKTPGQFVRNQAFKLYRDGRFFNIASGDLKEEHALPDVPASQNTVTARASLQSVIAKAPPAPEGHGDKNTGQRPTYPQWKRLIEPND